MKKSLIITSAVLMMGLTTTHATASETKELSETELLQKFDPSDWTKEQCNRYLDKVDEKINYFNNHPEEKAQAEKEGWFEMVEKEKALVNKRLKELKDKKYSNSSLFQM